MERIPIYRPVFDYREKAQLVDCVDKEWLTGGAKVKEFEQKIANLCNVKYGVACSNGTVALYLGLLALDIGIGDEVIVPDFTFIASANAVTWTGARPVFCDIDPKTLNMDVKSVESKITAQTVAIMPVHIYGKACDMLPLMGLAKRYKLKVIEDACQGIGVTYKFEPVGGYGEVGAMSFYADKTLTTGEGGMVLTNDKDIARRCLVLKHQGRTGRGWYVHDEIGYNFRMTDLQAGVGLAQLDKLPEIISSKQRHNQLYHEKLSKFMLDFSSEDIPFRYNVFVDDPDGLIKYLDQNGIDAKRVFYPLHRQPCYNVGGNFPNTEFAYAHGVSLPSSPLLTYEQISYICGCVNAYEGVL